MKIADIDPVKLQAALDMIFKKAEEDARRDDEEFNAYDASGGNFDDAFDQGVDDGEIDFARDIVHALQ